jgi:hypothetical protein
MLKKLPISSDCQLQLKKRLFLELLFHIYSLRDNNMFSLEDLHM